VDAELEFSLKDLLLRGITGDYTHAELSELFRLCYAIARQCVRRKMFTSKLQHTGLSEGDIVLDCIAELFRRDEQNVLVEFAKYFNYQNIRIEDEAEEMLLVHIRRLTFTVVSDNLFRIYNEADPGLGKILRNIKIAVEKSACFHMEKHFDEQYLVVEEADPLRHRPSISDEELTGELTQAIREGDEVPQILERLADALSTQDTYQRKVGLMSLALAMKAAFKHLEESPRIEATAVEAQLETDDVQTIIRETCDALCAEMKPRYLARGKLDGKTFENYFEAINDMLNGEFLESQNEKKTYYELLRGCIPGLTKSDYRENHRTVFEYLAKLSKRRAREKLKKL